MIVLSIAVGLGAAGILYRVLFYDFSDFLEGCGKFLSRRSRWQSYTPKYFEDEGWSSGIRFFIFLALSCGSGYLTYYELHKHFG